MKTKKSFFWLQKMCEKDWIWIQIGGKFQEPEVLLTWMKRSCRCCSYCDQTGLPWRRRETSSPYTRDRCSAFSAFTTCTEGSGLIFCIEIQSVARVQVTLDSFPCPPTVFLRWFNFLQCFGSILVLYGSGTSLTTDSDKKFVYPVWNAKYLYLLQLPNR